MERARSSCSGLQSFTFEAVSRPTIAGTTIDVAMLVVTEESKVASDSAVTSRSHFLYLKSLQNSSQITFAAV